MVDAANLLRDYASTDFLADRGEALGDDDRRSLVGLLVEQIEFADMIVITKADLVDAAQLATVRKLVASLNADARIVEARHGHVPLDSVIETGLFDDEKAELHPLWAKELYGHADHRPEGEEYGVESFVYRARAPFDPVKFHAFARGGWPGVVRAKGHFWLATRPDWCGELAQAGAQSVTEALGRWWACVPETKRPSGEAWDRMVTAKWSPIWGDRRQELVFIGIDMDEAEIRRRLDACLVPAAAFTPRLWEGLPDPFPAWGVREMA